MIPDKQKEHRFFTQTKQYLLTGFLTLIPLFVTIIILKFLFELLADFGRPFILGIAALLKTEFPNISAILTFSLTQTIISAALVVIGIYVLGLITTKVLGLRIIKGIEEILLSIPGVRTIYGAAKQLISAFQQQPDKIQRVVFIEFPSSNMKTIGFVTKVMKDKVTGRELAAVFVPTTPNPTSGYLEIVPVENTIASDMTIDEATSFIISGGTIAPDKIRYSRDRDVK